MLIPLLPQEGTFRDDINALLGLARETGIPLFTTEAFADEVYKHGMWASDLVDTYGNESIQVLGAARGEGYKRNAFLDGYIRYSVDHRVRPFRDYLGTCIGNQEFSRTNLITHLKDEYAIETLSFNSVTERRPDAFIDRDETEEYIRQQTEEGQIDKSDSRIRSEADAYAFVANWDEAENGASLGSHQEVAGVAVLSQGGFLNRIARFGPRPLNRYIVVPPDAFYGFLLRVGVAPPKALAFRELMVSHLFASSAHFVDWERYRKFFAGLINEAERIYKENLESLRREIDEELMPGFLDDVEPLDRPYFVSSLQARLNVKLMETEEAKANLATQLEESERKRKKAEKQLRNIESSKARKKRKQEANRKRRKRR